MNSEWFKDCKGVEQRQERMDMVKSHRQVLDLLTKMMERKLSELEAERHSKVDYESAGWAYAQADLNGSIRTVKHFINLLDQEEKSSE